MKRGSSVLLPPSVASKRHTHSLNTHTPSTHSSNIHTPNTHSPNTHTPNTHSPNTHTPNTHAVDALNPPDTHSACSSPFPAATSLFSPDVSAKMASDLLIRLSEATQKAQMKPGTRVDVEPQREALPSGRGGQQEEPGLALSPDGPGASPEPPTLTHTLTHTPDDNAMDTLASDLLRKLAERQEANSHEVRVKEEEEPMEVDSVATSDLAHDGPITEEASPSCLKAASHSLLSSKMADQLQPGANMADQCLRGLKMEEVYYSGSCQSGSKMADNIISGANMADKLQFRVKIEDHCVSGAKMANQLLSRPKMEKQLFFRPKIEDHLLSGSKMDEQLLSGSKMVDHLFSGPNMADHLFSGPNMSDHLLSGPNMSDHLFSGPNMSDHLLSGPNMADHLLSGPNMADHLLSGPNMADHLLSGPNMADHLRPGARMADQCLRAVLWQDMSVNLASTLLHQLSERASKANSKLVERTTPPIRSSPVLKMNIDPPCSSPPLRPPGPPHETQTSLSSEQGCSYFYRCHVCGFEMEGRGLFQGHMMDHRQWERSSFSLHCCVCDHSTNQEEEMRAHADTHTPGDMGVNLEIRYPINPPTTASSTPVAIATQPEKSNEHRCRICQRSFPGQQELLVHFQGHRQGNQYRCDRCGHLTRTANKLVEHVRVHTGERPFTCDLCPYSAKRRDSLRLHCKVKHPAHVHLSTADAPNDVHTHRSYVHGDNQRSYKNGNVQRLHTLPHTHAAAFSSSFPPLHPSLSDRAGWRDLSPLLPITTLISLRQRTPYSSASSSSSSIKHSFLGYLGLTGSS